MATCKRRFRPSPRTVKGYGRASRWQQPRNQLALSSFGSVPALVFTPGWRRPLQVASVTLHFGVLKHKILPDVFGVPRLRQSLYRIENAHARRRFRGLAYAHNVLRLPTEQCCQLRGDVRKTVPPPA